MNKDKKILSPVFVIGTGRCGLTPLMNLICYHKDLAWPSQYLNRSFTASKLYLSYISRLVDHILVKAPNKHDSLFIPRHSEAFNLWETCYRGFSRPFRDLTDDDVTLIVESKFKDVIEKLIKFQGKKRFIAEYSGWSRILFFKRIFPNAKFIHIVRDGRAVANSFLHVHYWRGWEGIYKWRWGIPPDNMLEKLKKYDYSFAALAGIQWKILIKNINENSALLDVSNYLEIRYEDLVKEPEKIALNCLNFLNLDPDCSIFKKNLSITKIFDANKKKMRIPPWRENLTSKHIDILNDILYEELEYYNYELS
ncbi:omega-hydroxy-beta-dihydromenaquinone-9 sulfotransferase [Candidatus Magnetomoraceae bacterium gMMP-1]